MLDLFHTTQHWMNRYNLYLATINNLLKLSDDELEVLQMNRQDIFVEAYKQLFRESEHLA